MISGSGKDFVAISAKDFDICLYHSGCPDGIGAAWCFWRENLSEADNHEILLWSVKHGMPYPKEEINGKRVVIVDFSYDRENITEMCSEAQYVMILDHHETAKSYLADLEKEIPNFSYIFDMDRSGAQIAWDWCYPGKPRPWFIEVIADRDLWKWEIPNSKEIGKALYYFDWYTPEKMEFLIRSDVKFQKKLKEQGKALLELENKDITHAVQYSNICRFENHNVRLGTCNSLIRSEVGNKMCELGDCEFAGTWRYIFALDQWWVSLRGSKNCTVQLNVICEKFGGGGHARASGFAIHGVHSPDWNSASEEKRKKMAYGTLRDYFLPLFE